MWIYIPCTVDDEFHILGLLLQKLQAVNDRCQGHHGCPMLIVMHQRDMELLDRLLLDREAVRRSQVLEVDGRKSRRNHLDELDQLVRVLFLQTNRHQVDASQSVEQHALALHDRSACHWADIA